MFTHGLGGPGLGDLGITSAFAIKALNQHWDEIAAHVPADLLPRESPPPGRRRKGRHFQEYGCGHYGCVLPTGRERVVLKVTTDPTEATFVDVAMKLGQWPEGIVRYYNIMTLPSSYRERLIVLIWREEAFDIGKWHQIPFGRKRTYEEQNRYQFSQRLMQFQEHGEVVRQTLMRARDRAPTMKAEARAMEDWAWDYIGYEEAMAARSTPEARRLQSLTGARAVAGRIRACEIVAEMMANEPVGDLVGQALEFYLEHGILLADVHANNVGEVDRPDYGGRVLVITDPGHAIML